MFKECMEICRKKEEKKNTLTNYLCVIYVKQIKC